MDSVGRTPCIDRTTLVGNPQTPHAGPLAGRKALVGLEHHLTAVRRDAAAMEEAALSRSEKRHRRRDFINFCETIERDRGLERVQHLICQRRQQVGMGHAWGNRIDQHACIATFQSKSPRERGVGTFGCAVVRHLGTTLVRQAET